MNTDHIKFLVLDVDGTMTDGRINVLSDGSVFKQFHAKDGLGIKMLIKKGIDVGIISHGTAPEAIEARAKVLGVKYVYAGLREKDEVLSEWLGEKGIKFNEVAYIGDDLNDLPVMNKVSISACPSNASDEVISFVDVVLKKEGGMGCIREFIDRYMGITYLGFQ
ncbi:KdsC family phosphatase [Reichenbachiella versicolor]|uniref:KdsC family phosphatase n=1 Tax=Reichenbachiella versicolor TaxID=1821036 RepID=UPI000D6E5F74|nr:HAD-IIIA family hydrolase [Reichenbachiella versicolor]